MTGPNLPLRALVVFEASARLGSFRAASEELGLTPSAVSHQIRTLEAGLGVRLFERVGRGVELSNDGRDFFIGIRDGFAILKRATEAVARRRGGRTVEVVRIQTPPSLASQWLLPRLPALLAEHPSIDIRVDAERTYGHEATGVDLAIVYGSGPWSEATPLLDEEMQPLCAPALAEDIRRPEDLLSLPLIVTRDNAVSWKDWFRRQGVDPAGAAARTMELDPSHVAIEAAAKGLGVVLESSVLTGDDIAAGRLTVPLPGCAITLAASYRLLPSAPASARPAVELVRAWLLEQAKAG